MEINQYANEAFQINDEDFYDVDYWTGTAFETRKISGLTLKTLLGQDATTAKREIVQFINKTGSALSEGTIVYLKTSSSSSEYPEVELADASTEVTSSKTIGAVYSTVANDEIGIIVTSGEVDNLDTSMYNIGDRLWLSTTAGQVTTTVPVSPDHAVFIGIVTRAQNGNGRILYRIINGYELGELHDVLFASTPNDGDVLTYDSATGLWKNEAAAGGLTYFTEAQNTTAPNATTYVDSLTASSSSTNADFAIVPKGNGALLATIPTGTFLTGNKRGSYAVDWQLYRTDPTRVASGSNSVISGGQENRASGPEAVVGGGSNNISSSFRTTVAGGIFNTASGIHATVGGGYNNVSSGEASFTAGEANTGSGSRSTAIGLSNTASGGQSVAIGYLTAATNSSATAIGGAFTTASGVSSVAIGSNAIAGGSGAVALGTNNTRANGDYSFVAGYGHLASAQGAFCLGIGNIADGFRSGAMGSDARTFGIAGRLVWSGQQLGTAGDIQKSIFLLQRRTTDATATVLTSNNSAPSTNNQVILQNNNSFRFKGSINAKQSGSTNVAAWDIDGLIVRGANAASTILVVSNVNLVSNIPAWGTPVLSADTTNGGLQIQVIGALATNIQWNCTIETNEVIYA